MSTPTNDGGPTVETTTRHDDLRVKVEAVLEEMKSQCAAAKQFAHTVSDPLQRARFSSQSFVMRKFAEKLENALK